MKPSDTTESFAKRALAENNHNPPPGAFVFTAHQHTSTPTKGTTSPSSKGPSPPSSAPHSTPRTSSFDASDVLRRSAVDAASPLRSPPLFDQAPSPPQFVFGNAGQARPLHEFATRPVRKSPAGVRRSLASPKKPFTRGAAPAPAAASPQQPASSAGASSTGFWTPGSTGSTARAGAAPEPAAGMAARFEQVVHVSESTGTIFTTSTPAASATHKGSSRRTPHVQRRSQFKRTPPPTAGTPMDYSPMDVSPLGNPCAAPTPPPFSFAAASPTAATPVAFRAPPQGAADLPAALEEQLVLDGQRSAVPTPAAAAPMVFSAAGTTRAARTGRKHRQAGRKHPSDPPAVALQPPEGYEASMQRAADDLLAQRRAAAAQRAEVLHQEGNALYKARQYDAAAAQFMQGVAALEGLDGVDARRLQLLTNCAACRIMLRQPEQAVALSLQALQCEPTNSRAACRGAKGYLMLGRLAEATALLAALPVTCSRRAEMQGEVDAAVRQYREATRVIREEPAADEETLARAVQRVQGQHESHTLACAATALLRAEGLVRLGRMDDVVGMVGELPRGWDGAAVVGGWVRLMHAYHCGDLDQACGYARSLLPLLGGATWHDEEVYGPPPLPSPQTLQGALDVWGRVATIKQQGNDAFTAKRYAVAAGHYSDALRACSKGVAPAFVAVLYCNRAAALHAAGDVAQALADCGRAKALRPSYTKAHTRMASLLREVGCHACAIDVLRRAEEQADAGAQQDLRTRLAEAERAASGRAPADHYKLLGVPRTCTPDDERKAYRRLALTLHPDKAMQGLDVDVGPCCGVGPVPPCAESLEGRVRQEADWLFKRLGEAHAVLSDAATRRKDDEEDSWYR